jgi:SIR2-like domain
MTTSTKGPIIVPPELAQRTISGKCVAVVGAGLSRGAGLPDWAGALKSVLDWAESQGHPICDRECIADLIKDKTSDLLMIAAELAEQLGPTRYRQALNAVFRPRGARPTEAHENLVSVPFAGVITTNYDKLIETAYAATGSSPPLVCTHAQAPELSAIMAGEGAFILKAHGDIDQIETVILGRKNYQELLTNEAYNRCMSLLCSQYTWLFLGFSLTDPDFRLTLDSCRAAFGGHTVNHYAIMPGSEAGPIHRRRFEKDYGITILTYKPSTQLHPEVALFIKDIRALMDGSAPSSDTGSQLIVIQQTAEDQIRELNAVKAQIGSAEYLRRLSKVAVDLWASGGHQQAWTSVVGPFERESAALEAAERVKLGTVIAGMALHEAGPERAGTILSDLITAAGLLEDRDIKFAFWTLLAECYIRLHDLAGALSAITQATLLAPDNTATKSLTARLAEARLLAGELDELLEFGGRPDAQGS